MSEGTFGGREGSPTRSFGAAVSQPPPRDCDGTAGDEVLSYPQHAQHRQQDGGSQHTQQDGGVSAAPRSPPRDPRLLRLMEGGAAPSSASPPSSAAGAAVTSHTAKIVVKTEEQPAGAEATAAAAHQGGAQGGAAAAVAEAVAVSAVAEEAGLRMSEAEGVTLLKVEESRAPLAAAATIETR